MKYPLIVVLLFSLCAGMYAQSERSLLRAGNRAYKQYNYSDAEVSYRKALEKNKELPQGAFNLGDALYKQGRFGEAADQYKATSMKDVSDPTKSQALHNLGNALLKEKKLPESIAAYKEALKLSPNDLDTKYNLEYAKALLKKEQQQQQQKNQQQKNDKQQQNKQQQDKSKQDQEQKNQQQKDQKQQEQQQRQAQQKKQQISKEDAERILEALKNEEKDVQKKLHKRVPARVRVEKDW